MVLTKVQKKTVVKSVVDDIKQSRSLCFLDFSGVSVKDLGRLRDLSRSLNFKVKIVKKRLLGIAMKQAGINFDPNKFENQLCTIFLKGELLDSAAPIYNAMKTMAKPPTVLGVYDITGSDFMDQVKFKIIAQLPSREALLTQLVYMLGVPVRGLMQVLNGRIKQGVS